MNGSGIVLIIDTSAAGSAKAALVMNGSRTERDASHVLQRSQAILPLIETLCSDAGIKPDEITEVSVVTGPGSYTGLRIGAAVANMFGALLSVPVNGKNTIVVPEYS